MGTNVPPMEEVRKVLYDAGEKNRRKVLGDAHVDKATKADVTDFMRSAQELATEAAWGSIWTREGLTFKQRSLVVVTLLSTMGKQQELSAHIKGALNNGLTEVEIREALLQVMVYTGMPNGLEAFRTADAAIQAWKAEHSSA